MSGYLMDGEDGVLPDAAMIGKIEHVSRKLTQGLTKMERSARRCAFVKSYVLNRARGHSGGMEGVHVLRQAYDVWDAIESEEKKRNETD